MGFGLRTTTSNNLVKSLQARQHIGQQQQQQAQQSQTQGQLNPWQQTQIDGINTAGGIGLFGDNGQFPIFNPTNPFAAGATQGAGNFFAQLFNGGVSANPFANVGQTGLSGQAGNAISTFMGQQNPQLHTFNQGIANFFQGGTPAGPNAIQSSFNPGLGQNFSKVNATETMFRPAEFQSNFALPNGNTNFTAGTDPTRGVFGQAQSGLGSILGQGLGLGGGVGVGANALQLPGSFDAFNNPGALGAASQAISALAPLRAQQQQSALGALSNAATNRFSTAFQQQGTDLMSQLNAQNAAQDAGIINQAQGLNLQQAMANQQAGLGASNILNNFFQGNAGLGLQQAQANANAQLGAGQLLGGLGSQLFGNQLGAAQFNLGQAGQNFNNALSGAQFGLGQNAQNFNQGLARAQFGVDQNTQNLQNALNTANFGLAQTGQNFNNALNASQFRLGQNQQNFAQQLASAQNNALNQQNLFNNLLGASQNIFNQGQGQFQNLLGAGQFGLQQNLAGIEPFLQMLGMGTQFAQPNPMEMAIIQQQQKEGGGFGGFLGTLAGGALGSFLGPMGAAAGAKVGNSLFG